MNQHDKLIHHVSLLEKGIKPADKINLRFRKQTKPYAATRTIFAIEVFALENFTHGMVISATKTTPSGNPSGVIRKVFFTAPEIDPQDGSILMPESVEGMPHTLIAHVGKGAATVSVQDQPPSVVLLCSLLRSIDVTYLMKALVVPHQDVWKWMDQNMLGAVQEEWDGLREDAMAELLWMLVTGAL
jgi:hypothetical protein